MTLFAYDVCTFGSRIVVRAFALSDLETFAPSDPKSLLASNSLNSMSNEKVIERGVAELFSPCCKESLPIISCDHCGAMFECFPEFALEHFHCSGIDDRLRKESIAMHETKH